MPGVSDSWARNLEWGSRSLHRNENTMRTGCLATRTHRPGSGAFFQGSGSGSEVIARIRHRETDGAVNTTRTLEVSSLLSKRRQPPAGRPISMRPEAAQRSTRSSLRRDAGSIPRHGAVACPVPPGAPPPGGAPGVLGCDDKTLADRISG